VAHHTEDRRSHRAHHSPNARDHGGGDPVPSRVLLWVALSDRLINCCPSLSHDLTHSELLYPHPKTASNIYIPDLNRPKPDPSSVPQERNGKQPAFCRSFCSPSSLKESNLTTTKSTKHSSSKFVQNYISRKRKRIEKQGIPSVFHVHQIKNNSKAPSAHVPWSPNHV